MASDQYPESTTALLGRIVDDVRELFREEVALARAEMRQELSAWSSALTTVGGGAVAALIGVFFLFLALAQGLAVLFGWMPWVGYLLVGIVLAAGGAIAASAALRRTRTIATLPRTTASLEETTKWMKSRMR